jgi:hypothetical protein
MKITSDHRASTGVSNKLKVSFSSMLSAAATLKKITSTIATTPKLAFACLCSAGVFIVIPSKVCFTPSR